MSRIVAVIGGGPAGMISAVFAARNGCRVVLYEKQKKLGSKIFVTGNGTCNISNRNCSPDKYSSHESGFIEKVLGAFTVENTVEFFNSIGLTLTEKPDGRMYPASLQAAAVAEVLEEELARLKVEIRLQRRVDSIFHNKNGIKLITAGKEEDVFDAVIIAAGGPAFPDIGGSGRGADLAEKLSHRVYPFFSAILPINIIEKQLHRLEGIKWDCALYLSVNGKSVRKSSGELLFTKFGISGPVTLDISRYANAAVLEKKEVKIRIDFFPEFDSNKLKDVLRISSAGGKRSIEQTLNSLIKKRIPRYILNELGYDPEKQYSAFSDAQTDELVKRLKNETVTPGAPRDFKDATTAAGGVDVSAVNPETMESRIRKNVFFAGEVLDVDGDCGGYNLQFCWSSGAIAGRAQNN